MAIGERIRWFRNLKGMTQKSLGEQAGFPVKTADIRIAQYESGHRSPKEDLINSLAVIFGISSKALTLPDFDSCDGLMHTLFALEDLYGLEPVEANGDVCLRVRLDRGERSQKLEKMLREWQEQALKLECREITREQYDQYRYTFKGDNE